MVPSYLHVAQSMAQAENGTVSISRVHEISNLPCEEDAAVVVSPPGSEKGSWPRGGDVKLENLQMRYKYVLDVKEL